LRIKTNKLNASSSTLIFVDKENKKPISTTDPSQKVEVKIEPCTSTQVKTDILDICIPVPDISPILVPSTIKTEYVVLSKKPVVAPSAPQAASKSYNEYIKLDITQYGQFDTTKSAFTCNKCRRSLATEALFETHIVREHAQTINIKDFHVDVDSYYQNLKINTNDSDKSCKLPPLVLNGVKGKENYDIDLWQEYEKCFEMTALKRFYCKLCENYYTSRNMVKEHLMGPKHKALKLKVEQLGVVTKACSELQNKL